MRYDDRHSERAAARGARPVDVDARRVQDRRRRPAPGRPGHLRSDHAAGTDQPRLRRRADDHAGQRHGTDGDRLLVECRKPRARGGRACAPLAADRHGAARREGDPPLDRRRRRPRDARGERGRRGDPADGDRGDTDHLRRDDRRTADRPGVGHGGRDRLRLGVTANTQLRRRADGGRGRARAAVVPPKLARPSPAHALRVTHLSGRCPPLPPWGMRANP